MLINVPARRRRRSCWPGATCPSRAILRPAAASTSRGLWLAAVGLLALTFALSRGHDYGWTSEAVIAPLMVAAVAARRLRPRREAGGVSADRSRAAARALRRREPRDLRHRCRVVRRLPFHVAVPAAGAGGVAGAGRHRTSAVVVDDSGRWRPLTGVLVRYVPGWLLVASRPGAAGDGVPGAGVPPPGRAATWRSCPGWCSAARARR